MKGHDKYHGIFTDGKNFYTRSKNQSLFGEKILKENKFIYRLWDPYRSKFSASLHKNLKNYRLEKNSNILYLGASYGNTVSFLSEVIYDGKIFAVEFALKPFASLLNVSKIYNNIYPIMADANFPKKFKIYVEGPDILIQDISQKNQIEIFKENLKTFPNTKFCYLFLKTRAIDAIKDPKDVLEESLKSLDNVKEIINLNPYAKDHYLIFIER